MFSVDQLGAVKRPASFDRLLGDTRSLIRHASAVILQVDATVSRINGMGWLMAQRDASLLSRLSELHAEARAEGRSAEQLICARLAMIRPRRAEVNALGRAYLDALAPSAVDAAHRLRSAGVAVGLSSDMAVEALFGVATALGITPEDIYAPTIRFDALGSFTSCELTPRARGVADGNGGSARGGRVYIGAQPPMLGLGSGDVYVRFTGFVERDGASEPGEMDNVGSFNELAALASD